MHFLSSWSDIGTGGAAYKLGLLAQKIFSPLIGHRIEPFDATQRKSLKEAHEVIVFKIATRLGRTPETKAARRLQITNQVDLQINMRTLMRDYQKSAMHADGDELFEQITTDFLSMYPDEKTAREALAKAALQHKSFRCPCGSQAYTRAFGALSARCAKCSKSRILTSDVPYFKEMRKPHLVLATLYIKSRCGVYSTKTIADRLGYSYDASDKQAKKVDLMLLGLMRKKSVIHGVDALLFNACCTRRSTLTPADRRPQEAQIEEASTWQKAEAAALITKLSQASADAGIAHLPGETQRVFGALSDRPKAFDSLIEELEMSVGQMSSSLTTLELDGLIERLAGDNYVRSESNRITPSSTEVKLLGVSKVGKPFINISHRATAKSLMPIMCRQKQGLSAKHLQLHIVDACRALTIFAQGKPLDLLSMAFQYQPSASVADQLQNYSVVVIPHVGYGKKT